MNFTHQLILASKSPRRQQLLQEAGFIFETRTKEVEETYPISIPIKEVPTYLAIKKAKALLPEINQEIIIASDTIVVCDKQILGKPKDYNEASEMLQLLSGRTHKVITGVCLMSKKKEVIFSATTTVTFKILTQDEIDYYITNYKPFDKAGSNGIQEWIGMIGVTNISGSYFTVMGLPVHRLYDELKKF
jgi:septum formation protein